jgi:signal transduction histidine kinase
VTDVRATSSIPPADLFVIDATFDASKAGETLIMLRARGAGNPIIVIWSPLTPLDAGALRHVDDALLIPVSQSAHRLPNAIAEAMQRDRAAANSPRLGEVLTSLRETQQLIAAGQIATRVRHDISNPLAALLAEAQLLEMDPLPQEQLGAVRRIVELCRRVVDVAKRLEGPSVGGAV